MVQKIEDIQWSSQNERINLDQLVQLNEIPYRLPKNFLQILNKYNGGCIDYEFDYFGMEFEGIIGGGIDVIYGLTSDISYDDIIENYIDPPEFFPEGFVTFGSDGGGNRICFDYRAAPASDNPPTVYWILGAPEGKDISFLANNFDEFLEILQESDDDELLQMLKKSSES